MKTVRLYHGSPMVIRKPELNKGRLNNDYGQGFYCTENTEMAKEWACKGKEPPAFSNVYELDLTDLTVLDLSKAPYTVLDWIAVLLKNRTFEIDLEIAGRFGHHCRALRNLFKPLPKLVAGF